jgi:2-oxoglutarate dehydrogenase E2 component (dihydrolipoamide succinyltransferase)
MEGADEETEKQRGREAPEKRPERGPVAPASEHVRSSSPAPDRWSGPSAPTTSGVGIQLGRGDAPKGVESTPLEASASVPVVEAPGRGNGRGATERFRPLAVAFVAGGGLVGAIAIGLGSHARPPGAASAPPPFLSAALPSSAPSSRPTEATSLPEPSASAASAAPAPAPSSGPLPERPSKSVRSPEGVEDGLPNLGVIPLAGAGAASAIPDARSAASANKAPAAEARHAATKASALHGPPPKAHPAATRDDGLDMISVPQ